MEIELSRLATYYSYPFHSPVYPIELAKAGFHYEGSRDEVVCHRCGLKYQGWQKGDVPYSIHAEKSPLCPFIKADYSEDTQAASSFVNKELAERVEHVTVSTSMEACGGAEPSTKNDTPKPTTSQENVYQSSTSNFESQSSIKNDTKTDNLSDKSYKRQDKCNGDDIPHTTVLNEKEENTPTDCPFNGTGDSERLVTQNYTGNSNNGEATAENGAAMEPLGVSDVRPRYPEYAILSTRISSYKAWPKHLNQSPEDLAKSGLFYEGRDDFVRCFHCAGGLREWEQHDDPFIEHARWFPFCTFIRQLKGDRFIMEVQAGNIKSELQPTRKSGETENESEGANLFDNPSVISVTEMGYSKMIVAKAAATLKRKADAHLSAENLLKIVWDLEEAGEEENINERTIDDTKVNSGVDGQHNDFVSTDQIMNQEEKQTQPKGKDIDMATLLDENRELKEQKTCKVCLDEEASIVFLPCGHLVTCPMCAAALRKCPVCRTFIRGTVKAIIG